MKDKKGDIQMKKIFLAITVILMLTANPGAQIKAPGGSAGVSNSFRDHAEEALDCLDELYDAVDSPDSGFTQPAMTCGMLLRKLRRTAISEKELAVADELWSMRNDLHRCHDLGLVVNLSTIEKKKDCMDGWIVHRELVHKAGILRAPILP